MICINYEISDLLTAYKGLLKEKEALEITLATFSKNVNETKSSDVLKKTDNTKATEGEEHSVCNNKIKQLEIQLATGLNSLATLSAEKSRMEASFQADKKQLRLESDTKDKLIRDLKESLKKVALKTNTELETLKSKLIIERHDREKEQNDHGVMIRELQKLLNDERHLKEQLDMQITDLKAKLYAKVNEADQKFIDVQNDVCKNKVISKNVDNESLETNIMLAELQNEISMMKKKHVEALEQEKERARTAEEKSR